MPMESCGGEKKSGFSIQALSCCTVLVAFDIAEANNLAPLLNYDKQFEC